MDEFHCPQPAWSIRSTLLDNPLSSSLNSGGVTSMRRVLSPINDLPYKEEVYRIVGCALEVLKGLGHGLLEKPYENALVVEFGLQGIPHLQQPRYPVDYKGVRVGEYMPDLIAFNSVVVDTKVIVRIGDQELGQMLNYLRITGLPVGIILNFKNAKIEWRRVVLTGKGIQE